MKTIYFSTLHNLRHTSEQLHRGRLFLHYLVPFYKKGNEKLDFPLNTQSFLRLVSNAFGILLYHFGSYIYRLFSFIISLNFPSRPSAILTTIVAFYINAVNRVVFLTKLLQMKIIGAKHILLKIFKRLPLVLYSSTTVVFKRLMIWLITPTENLAIYIIKSMSIHSVCCRGNSQGIGTSTTTRLAVSIAKVIPPCKNMITTNTKTIPKTSTPTGTYQTNYRQSSKLLSPQIYYSAHTVSLARLLGLVKQDGGDKHYQLIKYQYA